MLLNAPDGGLGNTLGGGSYNMGRNRAFLRPRFVKWSLFFAIATAGVCGWGRQNDIVLYGTFLQLVAILLVFLEVQGSVEVLSPGRLKADMAAWWTAVKTGGRPPPVVGEMSATEIGLDGLSMTGHVGSLTPAQGLEEQVKALEKRVAAVEGWAGRLEGVIEREARQRAAALEEERRARSEEIGGLRQEVVKASVADPWTTIFGIVCLFVGVLLSGTATSIVALRDRLG